MGCVHAQVLRGGWCEGQEGTVAESSGSAARLTWDLHSPAQAVTSWVTWTHSFTSKPQFLHLGQKFCFLNEHLYLLFASHRSKPLKKLTHSVLLGC